MRVGLSVKEAPRAEPLTEPLVEALDDDRTIRALVFGLAWPVIVENLLQTALGIVDLLMVSRLGAAAIAGVGVSVQVLFVVQAGVNALATGTTVLVARRIGAGKPQEAAHVLKQSILLALALGMLLAVVGVPLAKPIVALLGSEPEVVRLGGGYLQVVFLAAASLTLQFVLGAALRGSGDSRTPMLVALGVNAVNVVVAYVLIFGHLGFPALGVIGSAWGAAAARTTGALALLALLVWGRGRTPLRLASVKVVGAGKDATAAIASGWRPDRALIAGLFAIGIPTMGEQLSRSMGMLVYSTIVISMGTAVFAAQRITFSIISLSFLPGFGFAMSATALTGQALGAGKPERARRATWFSLRSACVWMSAMGVLFFVAGPLLMRAFTDDETIVVLGAMALRVLCFGQPQNAVAQVLAGGLRGAGDTRFPMLATSISMWLFRLPLSWFCAKYLGWGLPGAYAGFVVGSTLEASANYLRYRTGKWRFNKV